MPKERDDKISLSYILSFYSQKTNLKFFKPAKYLTSMENSFVKLVCVCDCPIWHQFVSYLYVDTLLTSSPFRATSPPSSWRPWPSSGHSGSSSDRMRRPQRHPRSQLSSKQSLIELVRAWVAATPRHPLSSACESVRAAGQLFTGPPPSCNTHCPLCQLIPCPPNESRFKTVALASYPGQLTLLLPSPSPPSSSSLQPAPTRSSNCTVQPTISRLWLQIVSTGAAPSLCEILCPTNHPLSV